MTFEITVHLMKISVFIMLSFIQSFDRIRFYTKKDILLKLILKHKSDLMWPSMIFEVVLYRMQYLRIHNISIHRFFFYQKQFINKCARKILNSRKDGKTEFFVRCKRTFVLDNKQHRKFYTNNLYYSIIFHFLSFLICTVKINAPNTNIYFIF